MAHDEPVAAARKLARAQLRKRFYAAAELVERDGLFHLLLDNRPALSPGRNRLAVAQARLGEAICCEWQAQGEYIDPAAMPVTRLVNTALDGVSGNEAAVRAEIAAFAGADLLCYRASEPQGLVDRQRQLWDPVIGWAERHLDVCFRLAEGVVHVAQPRQVRVAVELNLATFTGPLQLAGLSLATNLTGSALLALAVAEGFVTPDEAWRAAHVDEDWNIAQWGEDALAAARRTERYRDFSAAAFVLQRPDRP